MNNLGNTGFGIKFEPYASFGNAPVPRDASHYNAAEAAVAKLESIMDGQRGVPVAVPAAASLKRKPDAPPSNDMGADALNLSKKPLTNERREERNMREKERSLKITQQIQELRDLLSLGGVIVPKGTKSTILTEAANYIRLLQQHQYRSEIDKAQLVQEVQRIGNGAIGEKAAYAIRHAATQNGVSGIANLPEGSVASAEPLQSAGRTSDPLSDSLDDREYRCVFNSCSVGMAIATMGGSFIDCNLAFTELSSYTKLELKAMTIFNITSREDLQGAFDMMSQLITPPTGGFDADGNSTEEPKLESPVVLRSAIRHRTDLGLSVSLIRGEDGVARYFNITLVKLPPSPMELGGLKPVPAMADMVQEVPGQQPLNGMQQQQQTTIMPMPIQEADHKQIFHGMNSPQYTAG